MKNAEELYTDDLNENPHNTINDDQLNTTPDPDDEDFDEDELDDDNDLDDDDTLEMGDEDVSDDDDDTFVVKDTDAGDGVNENFDVDASFGKRDQGRTTGRMIDHEPGTPGI